MTEEKEEKELIEVIGEFVYNLAITVFGMIIGIVTGAFIIAAITGYVEFTITPIWGILFWTTAIAITFAVTFKFKKEGGE